MKNGKALLLSAAVVLLGLLTAFLIVRGTCAARRVAADTPEGVWELARIETEGFSATAAYMGEQMTLELQPDGALTGQSAGETLNTGTFEGRWEWADGAGTLILSSSKHGIVGKDDVKFTGGVYQITAEARGIDANDSVRISGGDFTVVSGKDAVQ